jgi:hypothetical protein
MGRLSVSLLIAVTMSLRDGGLMDWLSSTFRVLLRPYRNTGAGRLTISV